VKRFALALVTAAAATLTASSLQAQTCNTNATATAASGATICSVSVSASATVHDVMRLTLGSITQDLGTPNETDYNNGYKDANGTSATVKSNRPWKVTVVASTPSFAYDAQGSGLSRTKPSSDLLWGTTAGTYGNNMGAAADLFSGTTGTNSSAQSIFFRTNWSWANDVPGKYDITLNFTLSTP
jgi:hypothetical protein